MFPRGVSTSHDPASLGHGAERIHTVSLNSPTHPKPVRSPRSPTASSNLMSPSATAPSAPEICLRLKWNRIQRSQPSSSLRKPSDTQQQQQQQPNSLSVSSLLLDNTTSLPTRPLDDALRAKEASYVFTADGGQRLSPPLEGLFQTSCDDDPPSVALQTSFFALSPTSAAGVDTLTPPPPRQAAEQLDLQTCRRLFAASRQPQPQPQPQPPTPPSALQNQSQQQQAPADTRAEILRVGLRSSVMDAQRRSPNRVEKSSTAGDMCGIAATNRKSLSGFTQASHSVLRNTRDAGDGMFVANSDGDCCCCLAPLFSSGGRAAQQESGTPREAIPPRPPSSRSHAWCCLCRWMERLARFMNIRSGDLPLISQVFCVLNYIAGILVIFVTCMILGVALSEFRTKSVNDGSACQSYGVYVPLTPDLALSIVFFFLNGIISVVFTIRAVRYENKGLIMCHFITVVLQMTRVIYFLFTMDTDYLVGTVKIVVEVLLLIHGVFLLGSCCTYYSVFQSFGWRTFKKGITHSSMLQRRRLRMLVQSCVQLDIIVTLNAFVSLYFVVVSRADHAMAGALTVVSCIIAFFFVPILRRRAVWLIVLFTTFSTVYLTFYFYAVSTVISPYFIRKADKYFSESECYKISLHSCLHERDIDIVLDSKIIFRGELRSGFVNGTDTYLPTLGKHKEYFAIHHCDKECFSIWGDELMRYIGSCCGDYARCRLDDAVRSYGGAHLIVLSVIAITVRIALVHLAFRTIRETEEEDRRTSCPLTVGLFQPLQGNSSSVSHSRGTFEWLNDWETVDDVRREGAQPSQESHNVPPLS